MHNNYCRHMQMIEDLEHSKPSLIIDMPLQCKYQTACIFMGLKVTQVCTAQYTVDMSSYNMYTLVSLVIPEMLSYLMLNIFCLDTCFNQMIHLSEHL